MSWTITMRQERRKAVHHAYDGDKDCYVILCAQTYTEPVFVVEYKDGTCGMVPPEQIQFLKEEDECSE